MAYLMKRPKKSGKSGRPMRGDLPQRVTLYLSLAAKQKLSRLAWAGGTSMGRVLEGLIGEEEKGRGDGGAELVGGEGGA